MSWTASRERPLHLLYDAECRFCTAGSERLVKMGAQGAIVRVSSRDEAALGAFPAEVRQGLGGALQLVSPDGEVASGAAAVNRALATRGVWRVVTWVYWVPGVKQVCDWAYRLVAKHRYKIMGRTCESGACETGAKA